MALGLAALSAESATAFAIRGPLAVSSSGASAKSSAGGGVRAAFRCRRGAAAGPSENSKESPKAGKFLVEEEEEGPTSSAAAAMDDLDGTTNAAAFAASSAKRAGSPNFLRSWLNANFEKKSDETGTTLDLLNLSSESIAALVDDSASRKISTASIAAPKVQEPEAPRAFASTVGNTKLVELKTITPRDDVRILLKCEFQNPGASHKDRIAKRILGNAEKQG